ncbi:MAG: EF-hand domain-containing protein, partial [Phycisphaerales bacterium]|nr:EF-hand domain-containing protein [Phycisphaerales bacterium]
MSRNPNRLSVRTIILISLLGAVVLIGVSIPIRSSVARDEARMVTPSEGSETSSGPDEMPADHALATLMEIIERTPTVMLTSDERQIEEARAWVLANRAPDDPYNEFEIHWLAEVASTVDGDPRSASWILAGAEFDLERVRMLDVDRDGLVSDEEVERLGRSLLLDIGMLDHPYLEERLDADQDGVVSLEEREANTEAYFNGVMAGAIERATLDRFDADRDGVLNDTERETSLAWAHDRALMVLSHLADAQDPALEFSE